MESGEDHGVPFEEFLLRKKSVVAELGVFVDGGNLLATKLRAL